MNIDMWVIWSIAIAVVYMIYAYTLNFINTDRNSCEWFLKPA